MTKGLAFLNAKFFHPGSKMNRIKKYEAEQQEKARILKEEEIKKQKKEEDTFWENQLVLQRNAQSEGRKFDETEIIKEKALSFIYNPFPVHDETSEEKHISENKKQFSYQNETHDNNNDVIISQSFEKPIQNENCFHSEKNEHQIGDNEFSLDNDERKEENRKKRFEDEIDKELIDRVVGGEDPETVFLETLSHSQKKKLLRKLEKIERKKYRKEKEKRKRKRSESSEEREKKKGRKDSVRK